MPPNNIGGWRDMKEANPKIKIQRRRDKKSIDYKHFKKMQRKVFFSQDPEVIRALEETCDFIGEHYSHSDDIEKGTTSYQDILGWWLDDLPSVLPKSSNSWMRKYLLFHTVFPAAYDWWLGYRRSFLLNELPGDPPNFNVEKQVGEEIEEKKEKK